jgi:hypothetical protein
MAAPARLEPGGSSIALEVPERVVANKHHVTASTTVAAVWASLRHVRLAAETQAAIAAGPSLHMDSGNVSH